MAGQISHIIAGERAFENEVGAAMGETAALFRLGCQGPDIFYHNQRTKPSGLHYGALAHRRRFGSLVAGAAAAIPEGERGPGRPAGAYLLGLATHAAMDRATHPFIIHFSGWVDPSDPGTEMFRGCHSFLERLLDMCILKRNHGLTPHEYGLSERLGLDGESSVQAGASDDEAIVALWSAGLRAAYPRATGSDSHLPQRIRNALADARHFYRVTDPVATASGGHYQKWIERMGEDEGRKLISIVYPERLPEGMDLMNETGAEWRHPSGDGRRSTASYLDLVEAGVTEASQAISIVLSLWRSEISAAELAASLGEGGLGLCDAEGAVVPPRVCRPLALLEAMRAEYRERTGGHVDVSSPGRYDATHEHEG